ncbi:MAG TPA: type II secretion system protein [Candidatus Hydrogenedentes bacterium]|nr:type II secretion system protein [Candidatus Hydrogenedentota bacterium]HPC16990.1 type II secretion system protein [Candidatus Hydrogenedentota bacterium]HRT20871.1 type II secretion system protein [Candidatus Hydrogenedentota bacterium]HRT66820.1 type II secretion system protein [Candidatus Hydrogenedentota bacterium]
MSNKKQKRFKEGFSLLEITMAMAIFTVTIAVSAQSLITYYAVMDMQNQRVVAINQCRAILNQMRNARAAGLAAVVAQFPPGQSAGPAQLRNSTLTISYEDPAANPLVPNVTIAWQDLQGHATNVNLSTAITDQ